MSSKVAWDDQRIFLAVLETGSLSAAARHLGLSHPTVRGRIEALEHRLGTVLFTRSVNGLLPTETAESLRQPARAMAMASDLFVRQASAPSGEIAGTVRISVPEIMGIEVIPPMLRELREHYPALHVELSLSNNQADVVAHEVDVAVRTVKPRQEALVARKVASIPIALYAAPDYLAARGTPASIADLDQHDLIGPDKSELDLSLAEQFGPPLVPSRFAIRTDSHPAQVAAARAGLGIAVCQVPLGDADSRLVRVLDDFTLYVLDVWLVAHENMARLPRVRATLDHLAEAFGAMRSRRQ